MTSDKSGPVRTATPALDDDLEITRDRKALTGAQAPAESSETEPAGATSGRSSTSSASGKPDTADAGAGSNRESANGSSRNADLPSGQVPVPAPPAKPASSSPKPAAPSAKPGAPSAAKPAAGPAKPAESASSSASSAKASTPPAPPSPDATIPTTSGVWRSAYEAGRSDKDANPAAAQADNEAKAQPGRASAIGRTSTKADAPAPQGAPVPEPDANAKSWNRVSAPGVPPAPPAPPAPPTAAAEAPDGVRAGAMKAAQAALDAARSAAKKVSSIMPDDEARSAANPSPDPAATAVRPEMHYTAAGVRGTAAPLGAQGASVPEEQTQPASAPVPEAQRAAPAGPRRVRLAVSRVDPWSVMKLAFLLAVAIAIMTVVATAVFWSVLDGFGVFTTVQSFVEEAVGPQSNVNLTQFVEFPRVISLATLISICNIVLLTAIATIMAFLYNITAALVGGVHMTLTDD